MDWDDLVHEAAALAEYARRRKAAYDAARPAANRR